MSFLGHGATTTPPPRGAVGNVRPAAKGGRGGHKKKAVSFSKKAGLTISVARVRRHLRAGKYSTRFGVGAPVYLAAVLEYMCAEVLELAGNAARDNKCKRVTPRHITLAMRNDVELNKFLGPGVHISQGGVLPSIQKALIPTKKAPKTDEEKEAARVVREAKKETRVSEAEAEKVAAKEKSLAAKAKADAKADAKAEARAKAKAPTAKPAAAAKPAAVAKPAASKATSQAKGGAKKLSGGVAKKSIGVTKKKPSGAAAPIPVTRDDDEPEDAAAADEPDDDSEEEGSADGEIST
jgi:histone H2A